MKTIESRSIAFGVMALAHDGWQEQGYDEELRSCIIGTKIRRRTDPADGGMGHYVYDPAEDCGDVIGATFWKKEGEYRDSNAFSWCSWAVLTGANPEKCLPVFNGSFEEDQGFKKLSYSQHPDWPVFPTGWVGAVYRASDTNQQEEVFGSMDPRLVAPNRSGFENMGSRVVDLEGTKPIVFGPLQSLTRVIPAGTVVSMDADPHSTDPPGEPCIDFGLAPGNLAWQIGMSGLGDSRGGMMYDADDGDSIGMISSRQYGFARTMCPSGKHLIGEDGDGHPIASAHLPLNALWTDEGGAFDGPCLHSGIYQGAGDAPFKVKVYWEYDPGLDHAWLCGPRQGKHRWRSSTHFYNPKPPRITPPGIPPPLLPGPEDTVTIGGPPVNIGDPPWWRRPGAGPGQGAYPPTYTPDPIDVAGKAVAGTAVRRRTHRLYPFENKETTQYGPDGREILPIPPLHAPPPYTDSPAGAPGHAPTESPLERFRTPEYTERFRTPEYTDTPAGAPGWVPKSIFGHEYGESQADSQAAPLHDPWAARREARRLREAGRLPNFSIVQAWHPGHGKRSPTTTTQEVMTPCLAFRPQRIELGAPEYRWNQSPTDAQIEALDRTAPVTARISAFGSQALGTDWDYTEEPCNGRYPGGTADGGLLVHAPEYDLESRLYTDAPAATLSNTSFGFEPSVQVGWGAPLSTGLLASGPQWSYAGGTLTLAQYDAAGAAVAAGAAGDLAYTMAGSLTVQDALAVSGVLTVTEDIQCDSIGVGATPSGTTGYATLADAGRLAWATDSYIGRDAADQIGLYASDQVNISADLQVGTALAVGSGTAPIARAGWLYQSGADNSATNSPQSRVYTGADAYPLIQTRYLKHDDIRWQLDCALNDAGTAYIASDNTCWSLHKRIDNLFLYSGTGKTPGASTGALANTLFVTPGGIFTFAPTLNPPTGTVVQIGGALAHGPYTVLSVIGDPVSGNMIEGRNPNSLKNCSMGYMNDDKVMAYFGCGGSGRASAGQDNVVFLLADRQGTGSYTPKEFWLGSQNYAPPIMFWQNQAAVATVISQFTASGHFQMGDAYRLGWSDAYAARSAADQITITAADGVISTGSVFVPNGVVGAPAISFATDTNCGIYHHASTDDIWYLVAAGANVISIASSLVTIYGTVRVSGAGSFGTVTEPADVGDWGTGKKLAAHLFYDQSDDSLIAYDASNAQGWLLEADAFKLTLSTDVSIARSAANTLTVTAAETILSGAITAGQDTHQFAADTNDWAAPSVTSIRVHCGEIANYTLSGIASGTAGRVLVLMCTDTTYGVRLAHESAGSSAANRMLSPTGADLTLSLNQSAVLIYDGTSARWRIVSHTL